MRSNKGFTLIELLAVIVILAIIALIATPIIVGLLDDVRKEAAANSAYGVYDAAENVFAKVLLANKNGLPDTVTYTFAASGNPTLTYGAAGATLPADWGLTADALTLDYKGTTPTAGSLTLNTDGTVSVTSLTVNNFTCTMTNDVFTCN